jgi:hypothetical protein
MSWLSWLNPWAWFAAAWAQRPLPEQKGELGCQQCGHRFPVYRAMKPRGPVIEVPGYGPATLMNNGYVCFTGADGQSHHLMYWEPEDAREGEEEWEVICGGCRRAVALPARPDDHRLPARAPRYAPRGFGCPGHDLG